LGKPYKFQRISAVAEHLQAAGSISEAARRIGVDRSTMHRWIQQGKVPRPARRRSAMKTPKAEAPADWGAAVRGRYALSESEHELVNLGAVALGMANDVALKPEIRLAAAARFAALIRQLDLEPEDEADGTVETITNHARWPRRVG
jgi:transposase-like protein